jgi:hypothetical protein
MNGKTILTWKLFRFVAITVVLGAVGSGVWEWLLKPALTGTSDLVLSIATLGVQSFKDSLYKDIALGFREEPSLRLYSAVFAFLPSMLVGAISGAYFAHVLHKRGVNEAILDKTTTWLVKPIFIGIVFLLVFSMVQATQVAYVNRAITHFNQLYAIAAPFVPDEQRLVFRSQFAQVASREDYVKVVDGLVQVCRGKNIAVPEFSIW